ncbi:unnamed protein product [Parnassius apollo]|uniref:(apollo) hypothetical protein n=1 Tax=Parnassius apollo TaxID=110799 RepID=A0A8S3WBH7_PARAO|nr:unnamed protein product [Parnassius apollo]
MPLTPKEMQKLYRERMKEVNPEKFKLQQKQNAERTKRNRKRIAEYPLSDQEIIRKQWRERKKKNIASKSLKENYHDRMKKCSKKRKIKDIHLKTNKKLKTEKESSTDEDMTISLHDTSDEEYHITDDILSDDDYLDHMDYQLKEQKNVTNLRKISDTSKIEREKIEQSSHEDKKKYIHW